MQSISRAFLRACVFISLLLISHAVYLPQGVFAEALKWKHSYGDAMNVAVVAMSKQNSSTVYASVWQNGNFDIVKTVDGGNSWNSVRSNLPYGSDINAISVYDLDDSVIAISLWGGGVFLSENGGTSWSRISSFYFPRSVAISPITKNIIFIGIGGSNNSDSGIYKSTNKGLSWTKIPSLPSLNNSQVNIDPGNPLRIFADVGGPLYRSIDGGDSWTRLPFYDAYSLNTLVDRTYSNIIYTGRYDVNEGVYKSTDNGDNWEWQINGPVGRISRLAQETNGSLYVTRVSNGGGIWRSSDRGVSWENIGDPLWGVGQNVAAVDTAEGKIFAGVEYRGIFWAYTNGDPPDSPPPPPPPPPTPKHKACQSNNTCILVDGEGSDTCQSDSDCVPPTHKACLNNACSIVDGAGGDLCQSDSECKPPTHRACVNYACTIVDGTGEDSCTDDTSCVPPGPEPVVFIPGLGGSWSYRGLIQNQPTTYSDWQLVPVFTDYYYQPVIDTLVGAGLPLNDKTFVFAYDYRKSISESASWLNAFLENEVISHNPGKQVNIVGHSMGGLVARYCYQVTPGCANKIDKIITGGSPFRGALGAYEFWEGGKIDEKDLMMRSAERLLLHVSGFPRLRVKDIVQNNMPGIRDILPISDYIVGKPYPSLSLLPKN